MEQSKSGTITAANSGQSELDQVKAELAVAHAELAGYKAGVRQARDVMRGAARGDLEPRALRIEGDPELCELLHSINQLLDMTDAYVREAGASLGAASDGRFYRKVLERGMLGSFGRGAAIINESTVVMQKTSEDLEASRVRRFQLADDFDTMISTFVQSISAASTELHVTAGGLSESASDTVLRSQTLSVDAAEAQQAISCIASMIEEFSASIGEIDRQVVTSSSSAQDAVREATETGAVVQELAESSQRISQVLVMIKAIADQTNLLALNATIEAARAGEAGRGFAVVASEVKALSGQTGTATDQIEKQVRGIQDSTEEVVKAIASIGQTIGNLSGIATAIASAVEEQSVVTASMSENAQSAAQGACNLSDNINEVSKQAELTDGASRDLVSAAAELSKLSEELFSESQEFVAGVREG